MAKKKKTAKKTNPVTQLMKQAVTWTSLTKMLKLKPNGVKLFRVDDTGTAVFTIYAVKNKHMFYSSETKFYGVSSELTDLFFQKPKIAKGITVTKKASVVNTDETFEGDDSLASEEAAINDEGEFVLPSSAVHVDGPEVLN